MKIENNENFTTVDAVDIGDCFMYKDKLHMRIYNNDYVKPDSCFQYMAIDLVENKINVFANNGLVRVVNAKIVVG